MGHAKIHAVDERGVAVGRSVLRCRHMAHVPARHEFSGALRVEWLHLWSAVSAIPPDDTCVLLGHERRYARLFHGFDGLSVLRMARHFSNLWLAGMAEVRVDADRCFCHLYGGIDTGHSRNHPRHVVSPNGIRNGDHYAMRWHRAVDFGLSDCLPNHIT